MVSGDGTVATPTRHLQIPDVPPSPPEVPPPPAPPDPERPIPIEEPPRPTPVPRDDPPPVRAFSASGAGASWADASGAQAAEV